MNLKKRYALVGTGSRADMFITALATTYSDVAELVALCDLNETRLNFYHSRVLALGGAALPTYRHTDFDRMIADTRPDTVIVTTVDRTHHTYIVRALELGCDVITEKPMTTDAEKCQQIVSAVQATHRKLAVTFNYRYSPRNSKVKEILLSGEIGEVLSLHFEWLLDTRHGADYFRRWHRDKNNSGGLLVHKATHHFDLVNWWLADTPELVFAQATLGFYGRANAEKRGVKTDYRRYRESTYGDDPFAIDLAADSDLRGLYLEAEHEDGYFRDMNVFDDGISADDTMAVLVRYKNGTLLTYSLNAHCPWEGYRVMFNGTKGRLEVEVVERSHVSKKPENLDPARRPIQTVDESFQMSKGKAGITIQKHWQQRQVVPFEEGQGDHGGGDARLLDDLFRGVHQDPLGRAANYQDGVQSVLVGVAANRSVVSGEPVPTGRLLR